MTKDVALLVLRLSGLGLIVAHGWRKIVLLSSGNGARLIESIGDLGFPLPAVFAWAAALSEVVGGLAIVLGIGTRIAASFAGFTVFTAAMLRHRLPQQVLIWLGAPGPPADVVESWGDPEKASIYFLIFVTLILLGGGRFSLDRLVRRRKT